MIDYIIFESINFVLQITLETNKKNKNWKDYVYKYWNRFIIRNIIDTIDLI